MTKENVSLKLYPEKCLKKKSVEIDLSKDLDEAIRTLIEMAHVCAAFRGVGLAANQIGVNKRFFIMVESVNKGHACINPVIVRHGKEVQHMQEGCLSIPGIVGVVKRYRVIDVEYYNPDGQLVKETLKGRPAQIFQHEMDHLDGKLCLPEKFLKEYLKQVKKIQASTKKESRIILP